MAKWGCGFHGYGVASYAGVLTERASGCSGASQRRQPVRREQPAGRGPGSRGTTLVACSARGPALDRGPQSSKFISRRVVAAIWKSAALGSSPPIVPSLDQGVHAVEHARAARRGRRGTLSSVALLMRAPIATIGPAVAAAAFGGMPSSGRSMNEASTERSRLSGAVGEPPGHRLVDLVAPLLGRLDRRAQRRGRPGTAAAPAPSGRAPGRCSRVVCTRRPSSKRIAGTVGAGKPRARR